MDDLLGRGSAILSACGRYRYRLERTLGRDGPVGAFVMVNPSTADAEVDDPTIRKVVGFAARFGWSRVIVGNLFAYRATDVGDLATAPQPVGPDNDQHLACILAEAATAVCAWGPVAKLPPELRGRWSEFWRLHQKLHGGLAGLHLQCLGVAQDGQPLHPLMLGYDRRPQDWTPPRGPMTREQVGAILRQMEHVRELSYEAESTAEERRLTADYGRMAKSIRAYLTGEVLHADGAAAP